MSEQSKAEPFKQGENLFLMEGLPYDRAVVFVRYDDDPAFAWITLFLTEQRVPITSLRRAIPVW
jgi:hypothetical protein